MKRASKSRPATNAAANRHHRASAEKFLYCTGCNSTRYFQRKSGRTIPCRITCHPRTYARTLSWPNLTVPFAKQGCDLSEQQRSFLALVLSTFHTSVTNVARAQRGRSSRRSTRRPLSIATQIAGGRDAAPSRFGRTIFCWCADTGNHPQPNFPLPIEVSNFVQTAALNGQKLRSSNIGGCRHKASRSGESVNVKR